MLLAAARRSCSRALALPGTETSAGALSVVAVRRPRQPWRRWPSCRLPGCSVSAAAPTSSGAASKNVAAPLGCVPLGGARAGCLLALAVARRSTTTCCFASTQEQEPPPSNTGNKLPQPPPQRKAPWKPRQTCWRRCPCCAGSRRWRSWRSLRGGGVCRNGRQRRPTSAACSRVPTTRLQGETKHYGVYLANHRARARLTDLESKVYVRVQRLDQINAN